MPELRIAMIPGDGIGFEVSAASRQLLHHIAGAVPDLAFEIVEFPWNAEYYLEHGRTMPSNGLAVLKEFDAIFLGAIGDHRVPDHISLRQLIFAIRQGFEQYVNLRPVRLLNGVTSPLAGRGPSDFHMTFVRENSEGEYSGLGEFRNVGEVNEAALQTSVFT
ncbi:3-isopropylmalate dehydrogenase, partial [mine drainage metagenome]